ncbi:MAG TPA: protein kinase [Polyangiaceae bacterium]|nr:protein kinase [Polyangiaceae bacterium]
MAEYREFQDGESISGTRYRVVRLIGVGGMGTVYEVEHTELGKRFVLKALLRELSRREDLVIRLRNEWRALGRLEHPNIVTVTDAGTSSNGVPFYVMERLEGETLAQRMRRTRRFPVREAVEIAIGVLEGLAAAHQIGVVHRDVKPPNIFLLSGGRAKVLDFGVAKIADDPGVVTARGVAVGTPRYMSPEQARGEAVDGRADVYAVGLILFETIAGVSPFDDARDANELILAHLAKAPPRLSTLAMGVPPALDAMVTSMLAKGRDDRPDTASEAARRLRELIPTLEEARAALPRAGERPGPARTAAYSPDTTRPDGIAVRPVTPSSRSVPEGVSWLERPTLPRSAIDSQSASRSGPWSRISADTLVGLPPTSNPDSATPLDRLGRVSTEVLTAVPAPEAAVTRTSYPQALRSSETPPPVTPVEEIEATVGAGSKSRLWIWWGSAGACIAGGLALFVARPNPASAPNVAPAVTAARGTTTEALPAAAAQPATTAVLAPAPLVGAKVDSGRGTEPSSRPRADSSEGGVAPVSASHRANKAASAGKENRAHSSSKAPSGEGETDAPTPSAKPGGASGKKPGEGSLPQSGLLPGSGL